MAPSHEPTKPQAPMNSPEGSAPASPTPPLWALRAAALALEAVVLTPILLLALIGASTRLEQWVLGLFDAHSPYQQLALICAVPVLALVAAAVFAASWRLQSRSWPRIAVGYAALGAILAYLAHDDPTFRHPMAMEDISPVFPGEEAGYAVLMRYGKEHPLGLKFEAPAFKAAYSSFDPASPALWRETITSRRAEFEEHWDRLATERAWWSELNGLGRIGDLMPAKWDGEILSFKVIRAVSQHAIAIAGLQAIDGQGDQAVDTLLPILGVGRKLQPYSRTLVREMIGIVVEKLAIETATFILDTTPVSPEARARLVAALKEGDPEAGARHLLATEYAVQFGWMTREPAGNLLSEISNGGRKAWWVSLLNFLSPCLYLPRATFNSVGDLYADSIDMVANRKLDQMGPRLDRFDREAWAPGLKNPLGRYLALISIPAYSKVAENYWLTQDLRAALLKRLGAR